MINSEAEYNQMLSDNNEYQHDTLKDISQEVGFWKRLESFVKNVEVSDAWGYEEKEAIMYVCSRKIKELNTKEK